MVFNIRLSRGKWSVVMGKNLYSAFGFEYTHDVGIVHFDCITTIYYVLLFRRFFVTFLATNYFIHLAFRHCKLTSYAQTIALIILLC